MTLWAALRLVPRITASPDVAAFGGIVGIEACRKPVIEHEYFGLTKSDRGNKNCRLRKSVVW